ncbi:LOW QUALITY PROTEIN: Hypothetical protein PHPALM_8764 [Phytophthora palmivora]|uniref:DUF7869 domain-containing protein n=1 Tax=Phytophthora palmivora TaxID=4796 RepID=A0A2P4Y911_9STRA|nr:LOW QUALITY PROTEIN: Hypothetical protein PHPALM_8764 [Phytophthora palmivora]
MEELAALRSPLDEPSVSETTPHDRNNGSDGSSESEWQPGSSDDLRSGEEDMTLSDNVESGEEATMETSINLNSDDLQEKIASLIEADPCTSKCVKGKEAAIGGFLCSLSQMSSSERKQSILTALAVLKEADTVVRHRGSGLREQFNYYLPLVVCRSAYDDLQEKIASLIEADPCTSKCVKGKEAAIGGFLCSLSQMSSSERKQSILTALAVLKEADTVLVEFVAPPGVHVTECQLQQSRINDGIFSVKAHGNHLNVNASAVDIRWLVSRFKDFAKSVGDVVPVRVRKQKTVDGVVKLHYSEADYTLLPAYFTWNQLYTEMHNYIEEIRLRVREPQPSTFRQLLTKLCPTIRIRSPRSNVCDKYSILYARMKSGVTADLTEELGRHTESARRMDTMINLVEYKNDLADVSDEHAVIIMDYSQNLALPSVASTPSQWYFLSLRSVNVFGIYFANKGIHYNYVYDETVAGKGTDEVNSMLHHFIDHIVITNGYRKLTVYADNCGGQNKNNFVVKMLLALTHMEDLDTVNLKFFVKGHTKNAVDRGFGHMRKHLARLDVWTMDQLLEAVNEASTTSALVHIPNENTIFKTYRHIVKDAYKDLKDAQKYKIFSMQASLPGVVSCRKGPNTTTVNQDLRRKYDGILTDSTRVHVLFTSDLKPLSNPPLNTEKLMQIYTKVRPYVPEEFADDPMYTASSKQQEQSANALKRARAKHRKETVKKKKQEQTATKTSNCVDNSSEEKMGPVEIGNDIAIHADEFTSIVTEPATSKDIQRPRKRSRKDVSPAKTFLTEE